LLHCKEEKYITTNIKDVNILATQYAIKKEVKSNPVVKKCAAPKKAIVNKSKVVAKKWL